MLRQLGDKKDERQTVLKLREDYRAGNRNDPGIVRDQADWVLKHSGIEAKKTD